jgi:RNA polymerase sigma-70 factor (ECF subfamily)
VKGLHRFDGRAAFTTWTYRVATNACLDEMRRRSRRPLPDPIENDPFARTAADEDRVGQSVAARIDVDAALAQLSEDFRVVVVLRDHLGLEYAEIAETLEVPIGTVRSRLARGRGQLADLLADGNQSGSSDRHREERS